MPTVRSPDAEVTYEVAGDGAVGGGTLRRTGSVLTTDPEPDVPTLESVPAAEGATR